MKARNFAGNICQPNLSAAILEQTPIIVLPLAAIFLGVHLDPWGAPAAIFTSYTEGGIFDPTATHIKKRTDRNRTDRTDRNRTRPTGTGPTGPTGSGPDRLEPDRLDRLEPDRPDRPEPDRPDRTGVTSAEQRLPIMDHGSRVMDQRSTIKDYGSWIMDLGSWIKDLGPWTLDLVLA